MPHGDPQIANIGTRGPSILALRAGPGPGCPIRPHFRPDQGRRAVGRPFIPEAAQRLRTRVTRRQPGQLQLTVLSRPYRQPRGLSGDPRRRRGHHRPRLHRGHPARPLHRPGLQLVAVDLFHTETGVHVAAHSLSRQPNLRLGDFTACSLRAEAVRMSVPPFPPGHAGLWPS